MFQKNVTTQKEAVQENAGNITIVVVYDNYEFDKELATGHGFARVVKTKSKNILFGSGGDSETLLANMKKMNIQPQDMDTVFLSHIHYDHTGGLSGFLGENSNVNVFVPDSFPSSFKEDIESTGADVIAIVGSVAVANNVYSTGELGTSIKEQSMVINTGKGLVVITGCAHPDIVEVVRKSNDLLNTSVYLVLGGFHLGGVPDSELHNIIRSFGELGVEKVAPCHCTGDRAIQMFADEYGKSYIKNGVGKVIEV